MRKHTLQFLNRVTILLILYSIMVSLPVFAGSSDTWKSCCSSGCDYSPSCSPVSFSFGTYYCCSSGWSTSKCPECTTTTTTLPACSGSISLSLSPNPTSPSSTVTASADNLSNCNGKTIYIKDYNGCASGSTVCSCTSSSTGCSCTFTAPSSPGQYDYYACIDKNGNGNFADPGEQSSKVTLNVISSTTTTTTTTTTTLPRTTTTTTTTLPRTTTTTTTTTTTSTTIPPSIPKCNSISPTVTVLTPLVPSASNLKASVTFSCQEWNYTVRNLTLILYIDNQEWNQTYCFLNRKGLVTDLGWNGTQMDDSSPNCKRGCQSCGNNGKWDCDNKMNCKHKDYDLWVYSDSSKNFVNVTFTCTLPQLSPGSHTLTVLPVIYHSSIEMKPSKTTFMVVSTDGKAILQTLTQPFKVLLRIVFPFLI